MRNILLLLGFAFWCQSCEEEPTPVPRDNPYENIAGFVTVIPPENQRDGNPEIGKEYLITGDYIDGGIPRGTWDAFFDAGMTKRNELQRTGINQEIDYGFTAIINADNVEYVAANCMQCHAGYVDNQFVLGLGNTLANYTSDQSANAPFLDNIVLTTYGSNSPEWEVYQPFSRALKVTAPNLLTETVGSNPADKLALILAAHRDKDNLLWQDTPVFEIPEETIPADVPAWWLLKKKNAMFTTGLGGGDFAKHMMTASILTLKDTAKANEIDLLFPDVLAYLNTLEAPKYNGIIDQALASQGEILFNEFCSKCHGTYGANESYPNLLVDHELIQTDENLARGTQTYSGFVNWFNDGWFSQGDNPAEYRVVNGYVAPPLDGIWATAPYLHNGSVPTLKHLLKSDTRPHIWKKTSSEDNYDHELMGLKHTEETSKSGIYSYDTSLKGYSNDGHYFSDFLTDDERDALLEYLKTL